MKNVISYQTWKKYHYGTPLADGYKICGEDSGYSLFKSVYPKDIARLLIHEVFSDEEMKDYEFVYWPHPYKGRQSLQDHIEVWYKKIKK